MTPLRQSIYSGVERGLVGGYAVVLGQIVRRYVESQWGDQLPVELIFIAAIPVVLFPLAKFPMMLLAGGHLLITSYVAGFTGLVRAVSESDPQVWANAFLHGVIPVLVVLIARQNGPYGAALTEWRESAEAAPGHRRISTGGKLLLAVCVVSPLLLVVFSGHAGPILIVGSAVALAVIALVVLVALVRAAIDSLKPRPELPIAARRVSVQDRVRDQPNIRHQYRVGGD